MDLSIFSQAFNTLVAVLTAVLLFVQIKTTNRNTRTNQLDASSQPQVQTFNLQAWLDRSAPAFGVFVMLSSLGMLSFLEYGPDHAQPLTVRDVAKIADSMLIFLAGLVIARRW